MGKSSVLCILSSAVLFLNILPARGQQYYIDEGDGVRPVHTGRPQDVKPDYWTVRLYRKGEAPNGPNNWGSISGETAEGVMKELQESQRIEEEDERVNGPSSSVLTNFNYQGPIAVFWKRKSTLQTFKEAFNRLQELGRIINVYRDITRKGPNPFKDIGRELREYTKDLEGVQRRAREIEKDLDRLDPKMDEIGRSIDELTRDTDSIGTRRTSILAVNTGGLSGKWTDVVVKGGEPPYRQTVYVEGGFIVERRIFQSVEGYQRPNWISKVEIDDITTVKVLPNPERGLEIAQINVYNSHVNNYLILNFDDEEIAEAAFRALGPLSKENREARMKPLKSPDTHVDVPAPAAQSPPSPKVTLEPSSPSSSATSAEHENSSRDSNQSGSITTTDPVTEIPRAEVQLSEVYKSLRNRMSPRAREELKREEIEWIQKKDANAEGSVAKLQAVQQRVGELQRRASASQPKFASGRDSSLPSEISAAEAELELTYHRLVARLNNQQKAALKHDELQWIKRKDSYPANSAERLEIIETRTKDLQRRIDASQ